MHFLQNLLNYMSPPFSFLGGAGEPIPPGFDRVVIENGDYVVTSSGQYVIAPIP